MLKKDDSDSFGIILGEMLVLDLEPVFHFKNTDTKSLHEQILLLLWVHSVTLRV